PASPAPAASAPTSTLAPGPLPAAAPPTATTGCAPVFGSQLFGGRFAQQSFGGFNPDYRIAPGDRVMLRLWGAFNLDATQVVDPRGNLFLPSIGPVRVQGVRNGELDAVVREQVRRTYRANVQSYASLEAAQPVKVYVTGFVRQPGLYGGLSSDSVLHYLDQAGGIDPERGSFLAVELLRGGESRSSFDLYRFLLEGRIDPVQLHDGDTLFVAPRRASVKVAGEAANACAFEFDGSRIDGAALIALARPRPGATHMAVVRQRGPERRSEYHPLAEAGTVALGDGDEVTFTADRIPGTILVRIEGAHRGERTVVLPYGARLADALARVRPAPQADLEALQLERRSIALRQKEMLGQSLDRLEAQALTARSATNEEAQLRGREAELVLQFASRARQIEPRGQLVLPDPARAGDTPLEDGDTLVVPERSAQVAVHGEVLFPMAISHDPARRVDDYLRLAGGLSQQADSSRVLLLKRNGTVLETRGDVAPSPGDELMVLPRAETKRIEVTRGITQILYQIAVVAKVALGL
ncbi:MAG: hypothetical protein QG612_1064, partial [Pseudomonadota bacterium]|nr:hypothetical protein [Pseudomonadota bacterium]